MRAGILALLTAAVGAMTAAPAGAAELIGYDGMNPFVCELQQAGFGTDFPDPGADPFCVEYDKTRQNVTELGIVDFLSKEPARVAVASDKCFYFQHDHWRGSIVQSDDSTETYNWDGSYFFDKAKGLGGAYVENFTFNNQTYDPREFPGFPEEYKPYFGPGKGGVQTTESVAKDPRCLEQARETPPPGPYRCHSRSGPVGRGIGGVRIGMTRAQLDEALGAPARATGAVLRYCLLDGGKLLAGLEDGAVAWVLTTSTAFDARGVRVGASARAARRMLNGERRLARRGRSTTVFGIEARGRRTLVVGVRAGRVRCLALAARGESAGAIERWLDRSR